MKVAIIISQIIILSCLVFIIIKYTNKAINSIKNKNLINDFSKTYINPIYTSLDNFIKEISDESNKDLYTSLSRYNSQEDMYLQDVRTEIIRLLKEKLIRNFGNEYISESFDQDADEFLCKLLENNHDLYNNITVYFYDYIYAMNLEAEKIEEEYKKENEENLSEPDDDTKCRNESRRMMWDDDGKLLGEYPDEPDMIYRENPYIADTTVEEIE